MKERNIGLDIVRCVAIILVIFQHTWSGLQYDEPTLGFARWFHRAFCVGVPLFVMLSGALNLDAVRPVGEFLKKRFRRVLIPFLFWSFCVYVLSALMGKYPEVQSFGDAIRHYVPALLTGGINESYWFVYLLVGLYLLAPILQRAFHSSREALEYALCLWLGFQLLKVLYPAFEVVREYTFSVDVYLGYFLIGLYVTRYLKDPEKLRLCGTVAFLVGLVLNMLLLAKGEPSSLAEVLESVGLFALLSTLKMPEGQLRRFTVNMSRYSYTVYLTQMVPVGALCMAWEAPAVFILGLVLIVVLIEYAFCFCLDRWKLIPNAWIGI